MLCAMVSLPISIFFYHLFILRLFQRFMHKSTSSNPQYFEGILQLRNCTDEVINFVRNLSLKSPTAYISKEEGTKNGVDFYLSDNKFLHSLGKKLRESFTGELKSSASLHTKDRQSSKDLYRLTILFKQLHFKKDDVMLYQGDEVKILRIANDVIIQNIKSGKKEHISLQEAEDVSNYSK